MAQSIKTRGTFITLEGPDGAGKSSQAARLSERLTGLGLTVERTREPGGTALGEQVRRVLLEAGAAHDPLADALLFNAARRELVLTVIRPALDRGVVVICDRFADSTLAYQGYGARVSLDALTRLADIATDGLTPDRTILLDLPVEEGLNRRNAGHASELTRFETSTQHDRAFHERARLGYLELARKDPARWRVVDAFGDEEQVAIRMWEALTDLFGDATDERERIESGLGL